MSKLPIETYNPLFGLYLYPGAKQIMETQQDVSWTAQEIPVENDIHDYRHLMDEQQFNLVSITLQLFVEIEQKVGDIWNQIASWYPHSEIEGCATEIARMEKSVHAFFYQKMSDKLNIDPETIAQNQQTVSVLKSKLELLEKITINLKYEKALSLATVTLIEQVLLFSNFAMLKSFQSNGYNLIKNTITGVDFVVQDEQLHGEFAAYLFKTVEYEESKYTQEVNYEFRNSQILKLVEEIIAHEEAVIDYVFAGDIAINDITAHQLKLFIRNRADKTLQLLGRDPIYKEEADPIGEWFYKTSKSIKIHDFFAGGTNQYRRSWKFDSFSRLPFIKPTGGTND